MATAYLLSESDRDAIQELLRTWRKSPDPLTRHIEHPLLYAPEVYIARVGDTGISGLNDDADIGTAPGAGSPGSAECNIYQLLETGELEIIEGLTRTVYNLRATAISANTWILVVRDKFGRWISVDTSAVSAAEIDVVVKLVDGVLVNGKYDVLVQPRDNAVEDWTDGTPAWWIDLAGSTSLTAGDRYAGVYSGLEGGGPYYVSLVDANAGNALTDTAYWTPATISLTPLLYVPAIVVAVDIADGAQVIVGNSSPIDFASTVDVNIVDGDSSITAGTVTITGTDRAGAALSEPIDIADGGTATYTTTASFRTVTTVTVAGLTGAASGDTIEVKVTLYPLGVIRSDGTDTFIVSNPAGTTADTSDSDWTQITLADLGGYDAAATYTKGQYVQEVRPTYAERAGIDAASSSSGGGGTPASSCDAEPVGTAVWTLGWSEPLTFPAPLDTIWISPDCQTELTIETFGPGDCGYAVDASGGASGCTGQGGDYAKWTVVVPPATPCRIQIDFSFGSQVTIDSLAEFVSAAGGCGGSSYSPDDVINHGAAAGTTTLLDGAGGGGSGGPAGDGSYGGAPAGGIGFGAGGDGGSVSANITAEFITPAVSGSVVIEVDTSARLAIGDSITVYWTDYGIPYPNGYFVAHITDITDGTHITVTCDSIRDLSPGDAFAVGTPYVSGDPFAAFIYRTIGQLDGRAGENPGGGGGSTPLFVGLLDGGPFAGTGGYGMVRITGKGVTGGAGIPPATPGGGSCSCPTTPPASASMAANVWANVTVASGTPTLQSGLHVASIVDNGVGDYTVKFSVTFSSGEDYTWSGSCSVDTDSNPAYLYEDSRTASQIRVKSSTGLGVNRWGVIVIGGNVPGSGGGGGGGGPPPSPTASPPTITLNTSDMDYLDATLTIAGTGFDLIPGNNSIVLSNGTATVTAVASSTSLTITFITGPTLNGPLLATLTNTNGSSAPAVQVANVTGVPASGLVFRWPLDEGSGNTANALDFTGADADAWDMAAATTGSWDADGYMQVGGSHNFQRAQKPLSGIPLGNSARSVTFWIKRTSGGLLQVLAYGPYGQGPTPVYDVHMQSGVGMYLGNVSLFSSVLPGTGAWHHVAITWSGTGVGPVNRAIYYIDGVEVDRKTSLSPLATATPGMMFMGLASGGQTGTLLCDVRLYGVEISAATAAALFDAGVPGASSCKSIHVSGSSQYATANIDGSALTAFTISLWVKRSDFGSTTGLFQWATGLSSGTPAVYLMDTSTTLEWYIDGNYRITGISLTDDVWTHLALTWDGSNWEAYVNGSSVGTYTGGNTYQANADTLYLGNGYHGYWIGNFDDVRVYDAELSSGNITTIYNSGCPAEDATLASNLIGRWKFDEGSGTTASDSGGSNDMTLVNGVTWQSDCPCP